MSGHDMENPRVSDFSCPPCAHQRIPRPGMSASPQGLAGDTAAEPRATTASVARRTGEAMLLPCLDDLRSTSRMVSPMAPSEARV
jgi:hypothetical protein